MASDLRGKFPSQSVAWRSAQRKDPNRLERRGDGRCLPIREVHLATVAEGEKVRFAVATSQVSLFRDHLAWPLSEVVDRGRCSPGDGGVHIPLMSLISLLDANTLWGRRFAQPTWKVPNCVNETGEHVGVCWASNPKDRTMHAYKELRAGSAAHTAAQAVSGIYASQPANG